MRKTFWAMALALSLLLLGGGQALAATTRVVDKDGKATPSNCNSSTVTPYTTIQSAVDASGPNDTIKVCPATYEEQVNVSGAGKNGIKLVSTSRRQAVIKWPLVTADLTTPDLVTVNGARGVSFQSFTIAGPFTINACLEPLVSGVRIKGDGSATLVDNRITEIRNAVPALRGCQNGFAVAVGRRFESQTGDANLFLNQIDKYQKGGLYADNEGTDITMSGNAIIGIGSSDQIAQNGVQISRGADAFASYNLVQDNSYIGGPDQATDPNQAPGQGAGVLLFNPTGESNASDVRLENNLARRNDTNFALFNQDKSVLDANRALDAPFFDGIFADSESTNNRFEDNRAFGNEEFDCLDDSTGGGTRGTANLWKNNEGVTSSPEGICKKGKRRHDDDDDDHDHHGYGHDND
jgi:Right handed beta helix region